MSDLGRYEDLPEDYRERLTDKNLVPLWPSLRGLLPPGKPAIRTQAIKWAYKDVRGLLTEAGELTPIEKAERRVLVLANPGHGLANMQATSTIYMGMQLILPGEVAPNHRHTPNAVRIVVEGEGAFTTVNGEPCTMLRGDLVLTPTGLWHEHHHEGEGPFIWLDMLDLPLMYYLETSWATEGPAQKVVRDRDRSFTDYVAAGVVPQSLFARDKSPYPLMRYPWERTRQALLNLAEERQQGLLQVAYVNPENGHAIFPTFHFSAIMLRPGESQSLGVRTSAAAYHVVEGSGTCTAGGGTLIEWTDKDTFCSPGYDEVILTNLSKDEPAFLIIADDSPLHDYLRVF